MSDYVRGKFVEYRATTSVHLGKIGVNVEKGTIVEYDGQVLKHAGTDYAEMQTFQSAIRVGWAVPVTDTTSVYKPVVSVPAPGTKSKISSALVHDEDRDVGSLQAVRDSAAVNRAGGKQMPVTTSDDGDEAVVIKRAAMAPATPAKAPNANTPHKTTGKFQVTPVVSDGEGQVVGTMKSAKTSTVLTAENAMSVAQGISRMDSNVGSQKTSLVTPVARMPVVQDQSEVVSATTPMGKTASVASEINTKAKIIPTDMGFDMADTGAVLVASLGNEAADKLKLVRSVLPSFEWDMTVHWKTRVKVALEHKGDAMFMFGVMAVESDAVKKAVQEALAT